MTPIEWYLSLPLFTEMFLAYVIAINIITFFAFGIDKLAATAQRRRTPETTLWILTALGGSIGALAGMEFFKHKRRKVSFYSVVLLFFLIHALIIYIFVQ